MKDESFNYILSLTVREKLCQPYDVIQNKGKIQIKIFFCACFCNFWCRCTNFREAQGYRTKINIISTTKDEILR